MLKHLWSLKFHSSVRYNHAQKLKSEIPRRPIDKVLIANRGEIACRVIKTARRLGVRTVAVFSDADEDAMHVDMADEAYHIGPSPSTQSYLNGNKIIEVAKKSNSQAIHPGYGFLSENLEFCEKCEEEGIIFIGPPASAIRDMGIKSTSKEIMARAGVPVVAGYHGAEQAPARLQAEARRVGFPLMIKAVRGGGGKGMRIARTEDEFLAQLESAKVEAMKAFGDDSVLLEQYVAEPRHVEVQIFGDLHGNVVHLFERDCSVQRRHQKVLEEAPAPGLSAATRAALGAAAVRAARAVRYAGAGTVEFLLRRRDHAFHFMEMNTRLQVEHAVTEAITGLDLVEWQLRVAGGEELPLRQEQLAARGHAVEVRVYAEEPRAGFLPRAGTLARLVPPAPGRRVRVDSGVREGDRVSAHYDPMLAKLVVWAPDRRAALRATCRALAEYRVAGLETNVEFLRRLAGCAPLAAGDVHTGFLEQHAALLLAAGPLAPRAARLAALGYLLKRQQEARGAGAEGWRGIAVPPAGWRPNYPLRRTVTLLFEGKETAVCVESTRRPDTFRVRAGGGAWAELRARLAGDALQLRGAGGGAGGRVGLLVHGREVHVYDAEFGQTVVRVRAPGGEGGAGRGAAGEAAGEEGGAGGRVVVSPTPGVLEKVLVAVGDRVCAGQPLCVVVAMKMEHVVRAPRAGRVAALPAPPAAPVARRAPLVVLEA